MSLIDRHILREWLKIFGLVVSATLGLLLMQTMYEALPELLDKGASLADTCLYFAVRIPSFLAVLLPIVILVSLLYSLGMLHRNNEIMAMRASGLGLFRITRTLWLAGMFLCGVMWLLNSSVVPWSVEASRSIIDQLDFRLQAQTTATSHIGVAPVVTFDNQRNGRMWFMNRFNRFTRRGYGVSVSELDSKRREKTRILAREARLDPERKCWIFWDGRETWLDPETGDVIRTVAFAEKVIPHFQEDPSLMLIFDIKPSNLSFFELRRIIDYFTVNDNPKVTIYAVRYYGLLADTLAPLIVIAIAIPFAITGVRVNPAVGVSKSIGLFLLYIILLKFSYALGSRSLLDPVLAAWIPNLAMLALGVWLFVRRR